MESSKQGKLDSAKSTLALTSDLMSVASFIGVDAKIIVILILASGVVGTSFRTHIEGWLGTTDAASTEAQSRLPTTTAAPSVSFAAPAVNQFEDECFNQTRSMSVIDIQARQNAQTRCVRQRIAEHSARISLSK